jgi:hypothetical protein
MSRSLEITGSSIVYLFYAVSLAGLLSVLFFVLPPLSTPGTVALATLLVGLTVAGCIGCWRRLADRDGDHLGTAEDLAYDPIAYPGQAAKHRWEKAIRRLPGRDDD